MSAKFDLKNNFLSIKKPKNSGKRKVKSYMRKESMNTLQDEGNGDEESSLIELSSISSCSFGSLEGLNKSDRASKVQMLSKAVLCRDPQLITNLDQVLDLKKKQFRDQLERDDFLKLKQRRIRIISSDKLEATLKSQYQKSNAKTPIPLEAMDVSLSIQDVTQALRGTPSVMNASLDHQKQLTSLTGQNRLQSLITGNLGLIFSEREAMKPASERMRKPHASRSTGVDSYRKSLNCSNFSFYIERESIKQKRVITQSLKRRKFNDFRRFLAESPAIDECGSQKSRKGHQTLERSPECGFQNIFKSPLTTMRFLRKSVDHANVKLNKDLMTSQQTTQVDNIKELKHKRPDPYEYCPKARLGLKSKLIL
ncbi:unnamed protein product [Moneuplotes crassus]|uniref:Uncharacterized protein n=1 Tax=Euplotes crassus TaxID=5936 RepID=A0AAD1Y4L3_EUPCR|nr:unnamed protein product [Moneuplotes crassus]